MAQHEQSTTQHGRKIVGVGWARATSFLEKHNPARQSTLNLVKLDLGMWAWAVPGPPFRKFQHGTT